MGQTNDYEIGICCFPTKHAALRTNNKRTKTGWLRIMIICVDTRLPTESWFSVLTIYVGLVQSGYRHHLVEM